MNISFNTPTSSLLAKIYLGLTVTAFAGTSIYGCKNAKEKNIKSISKLLGKNLVLSMGWPISIMYYSFKKITANKKQENKDETNKE